MHCCEMIGSIVDLPDDLLNNVITTLVSSGHGNPGDVCRLMLVRASANISALR